MNKYAKRPWQILPEECRANARLISAAPDLYKCLMHLQNHNWFREGVTGEVTCILNADMVRAALHKATIGEQ